MKPSKFHKPARVELHVLEQDETWYERSYWLALLVRELKDEVARLRQENAQLLQQVNSGEPLSFTQEEFLAMREELNQLHKAKAKVDGRLSRAHRLHQSLKNKVEDLNKRMDGVA